MEAISRNWAELIVIAWVTCLSSRGCIISLPDGVFVVHGNAKGLSHREAKYKINDLLEQMNLTEVSDRKIGGYSGGMKQRLLIAQAVMNSPDILVLDEPTAGLDPKERINIRNFVSELSRECIVIFATHVVSDVECIAKR